jgi:Tol biopolymer transport system component
LTSDSTYYARAYGTNSIGTGYGKIVSFTPTPATPIDYLGQTPPSLTPEPFAHYIFENFALHSSPAFSPDGNEVFWSSFNMGLPGNYKLQLWCMKQENNIWGEPQIATFLLNGIGDSPVFSPDGQTLFFLSGTPTPNNPNNTKENLYYAAKTETSWSEPVLLGQNFDDYTFHWQVSLAGNRNLYFSGYPTALITDFERDIMLAQYQNGTYGNFVNLGDSVNTPDQLECTPCVAPDERFLIFSRGGTSDFSDLYISFKKTDGTWTTAKNMTGVNSPFHDLNPLLTPDGKYLIFTSGQDGWPYWVDASVIEQYR